MIPTDRGSPKIGVYICHCGTNIAGMVDVEAVADYATSLENVSIARHYAYMCSDPGQDMIDIEVTDPALDGRFIRDLRLPLDTLIVSLSRDGQTIVSHGYTQLKLRDKVTVIGSPKSLEEVALKFEA